MNHPCSECENSFMYCPSNKCKPFQNYIDWMHGYVKEDDFEDVMNCQSNLLEDEE